MSDETTLLPCPFCGGENVETSYKDTFSGDFRRGVYCADCCGGIYPYYDTEAEAIAAWNTRADLGSDEPPYDELLRCLESDWHISASWDGLRKFWCVELTEEGAKLRDAAHGTLTAEQVREAIEEAKAELLESCEYVGTMSQRQSDVLKAFGKMEQAIADDLLACNRERDHYRELFSEALTLAVEIVNLQP